MRQKVDTKEIESRHNVFRSGDEKRQYRIRRMIYERREDRELINIVRHRQEGDTVEVDLRAYL